jgi:hypothetical protein
MYIPVAVVDSRYDLLEDFPSFWLGALPLPDWSRREPGEVLGKRRGGGGRNG